MAHNTYRKILDMCQQDTIPMHQTLYLIHMRPKKNWNPALWEIPGTMKAPKLEFH